MSKPHFYFKTTLNNVCRIKRLSSGVDMVAGIKNKQQTSIKFIIQEGKQL